MRVGAKVGGRTPPGTQTVLAVTVTDGTDPVVGGANEAYTVQVTNNGGVAATNVVVVVRLDPSTTYVSAAGTGWTFAHAGGTVTATRASAATGAAPAITVTAAAGPGTASVRTSAQVSAANAPTASAFADTAVSLATLSVVLSDTTDPIAHSVDEVYTVQVTNTDLTHAAASVSVAVTLDPLLAFVSAAGTGWTCNAVGQVVTCTRASLASNTAAPLISVHTTPSAGTAHSTAVASAANAVAVTDAETTTVT